MKLHPTTPPPNRELCIKYVPTDRVQLNPKNPRRHDRKTILDLAASISRLGMNAPLLVDRSWMLLAGEARLRAVRELSWATVPVIPLDHLTEAEAQIFMIAENRFGDRSSFDDQALGLLFKELSAAGLDFSLELSGFATGRIDFLIAAADFTLPETEDEPPTAAGPAVTGQGEVYLLRSSRSGLEHRLIVADALQASSYGPLFRGAKADAVIIDPPFGGSIAGYLPSGRTQHREFVMGSENRTPEQLAELLEAACTNIRANTRAGSLVFVFMDWRGIETLLRVGRGIFGELKNLIVWVKSAPGMGAHYRSQHELIALFKVEGGRHKNNIDLGRHGRNRSNVWQYAGMTSPSARKTDEGDLLATHPTCKPVNLVADAIMDCTERGDIVLDVFLGSGTTLIAAERVGRRCFAMELDPLYADTAIRRFRRLTGETAIRESDGRSFDDLEDEAGQ